MAEGKPYSTNNARAESVATSNAYREPWKEGRRCLVSADGFYEWPLTEARKVKRNSRTRSIFPVEQTLCFAGLWDRWYDQRNDTWLQSFTIVTTDANPMISKIHNRMPVILHSRDYDEWLMREGPAPAHLMRPFPTAEMAMMPVSKDVGNVRNNHPALLNSR